MNKVIGILTVLFVSAFIISGCGVNRQPTANEVCATHDGVKQISGKYSDEVLCVDGYVYNGIGADND